VTPLIRPVVKPRAVRIAPACADRKTAEVIVYPPCSSYIVETRPPLVRCELYAGGMRYRSCDTPNSRRGFTETGDFSAHSRFEANWLNGYLLFWLVGRAGLEPATNGL
jgi:hypothetical protein